MEKNIIITKILQTKADFLEKKRPYIPSVPRQFHAIAIVTDGTLRYTRSYRPQSVQPQSAQMQPIQSRQADVTLSAGEILFIRRGRIDIAETGSDSPVHYITADFMTADDDFPFVERFQTAENQQFYLSLFREMAQFWTERSENWQMESIERLYRILNGIRREENASGRLAYRHRVLVPVIQYLNVHIADSRLTVAELAQSGHICPNTLNRLIHEVYNMSASRWILSRRMELARDLLANSSNRIGDVAHKTGFADIYSFSHAFCRLYGISPSDYRSGAFGGEPVWKLMRRE